MKSPATPRWQDVLLAIPRLSENQRYCEKLNRLVKGSRTHLRKVVQHLVELGLLREERAGRVKKLSLTDRGQRIALALSELKSELAML